MCHISALGTLGGNLSATDRPASRSSVEMNAHATSSSVNISLVWLTDSVLIDWFGLAVLKGDEKEEEGIKAPLQR